MQINFNIDQLSWVCVAVPAVFVAIIIGVDNRYCGPYFAIADVVLGDPDAGMSLRDREVRIPLIRRSFYVVAIGAILALAGYSNIMVASVFFTAGFLMIWPAFLRPLPRYVNRDDWQVLMLWGSYIAACVALGLAGANAGSIIRVITGQSPGDFLRNHIMSLILDAVIGMGILAFSEPISRSLTTKVHRRRKDQGA